jgi:hypothetical protein
MYTIVCDGVISVDTGGAPVCSTGWTQQIATIPFDMTQIDPIAVVQVFGAGFAFFVVPWAIAWGGLMLIKALKGL